MWLPTIVIWCAKPWLDRTILFVLSRAAFGQQSSPAALWRAQREVWWRQLLFTWSVRRFSPWRAFTQPVYQLEGGPVLKAGVRIRQLRRGNAMSALMATHAFCMTEFALTLTLVPRVLVRHPASCPKSRTSSRARSRVLAVTLPIAYGAAVFFVEPFYVASDSRVSEQARRLEAGTSSRVPTVAEMRVRTLAAAVLRRCSCSAPARGGQQPATAIDRPTDVEIAVRLNA